MRTDELRRELHDLADELDPFTGNSGRVRTRVRRTRRAKASALTLALVIAVGVVVAVAGDDGDDGVTTVDGKAVDLTELGVPDALITATPEKDSSIREVLDRADIVDRYVMLPGYPECPPNGDFFVDLHDGAAGVGALEDLLEPDTNVVGWYETYGDYDLEVFMNVDATPAQVQAVADELATDENVVEVQHLTKADAFHVFSELYADKPDLVAATSADALPESFRLKLRDTTDVRSIYTGYQGVNSVTKPGLPDDEITVRLQAPWTERSRAAGESEIFMNVDATDAQIDAVRATLDEDPNVVDYHFLTKEQAYAEFRRIFANEPALIESTDPNALPTSFRVKPTDGAELQIRYNGILGVNEVITPDSICNR